MARKTLNTVPQAFVEGAEVGFATRTALATAKNTVVEATSSTRDRVGGFMLGLFGPKTPKTPKPDKAARHNEQLMRWIEARSK